MTTDITALEFGPGCYGASYPPSLSPPLPESENCLFLNIYTPADVTPDADLSVMVWLHGGGFCHGSARSYDGSLLASEGVVVVTVNYRLGVFGFLTLDALMEEGDGVNFGLRDQQVAFEWVREHIAAFGGNPNDITAFGESAGAMSIALHMISGNGDQRLFHKAIMQSGSYTSTYDIHTKSVMKSFFEKIGCPDANLNSLRNLTLISFLLRVVQ